MITFKQFLQEDERNSLLGGIITNLLKKGEKVLAFAKVFNKGKKEVARLYPITKVEEGYRLHLQVSEDVYTWFELYGADDSEAADELMYLKKEGDTWVLAEKGRKPIIT